MIKITTNSAFTKILNFIKIGNHIHINVIIVKILKNAVSLIIKYSALKNIKKMRSNARKKYFNYYLIILLFLKYFLYN